MGMATRVSESTRTMSPADRRSQLEDRFPIWEPKPIDAWFRWTAQRFGDRPFIATDDRTYTYAEMAKWVDRIAAGLVDRGYGHGDRIALLMANYPEFVAIKYAVSRIGGVLIPLNFMFKRDELAFVLKQSEAKVLVTMTGFRDFDYLTMLDEISADWLTGRTPELPDLELVIQFGAEKPERDGILTLGQLADSRSVLPADLAGAGPDDVSIIFYTSGTTGLPKGVMWTHDQDARVGYGGALSRAFGDGWRVLTALPLYHAFANNEALNAAMFAGGALIPLLSFDATDFLQAIERHRPHELVTVPTMVVSLCDAPVTTATDTSSVVGLMSAGAPAPVWLWERAIDLLGVSEVTTGYGMTETGGGQVMSQPEDGIEHVSSTVGRIKYGGVAGMPESGGDLAEMHAVDPQTGEFLPDGEEGELVSRGPTNALGYWKRPEETAETFRDGWVFTGDLGKVLPGGVIVLTGRKKELIRSGAENYAPKEVEDLLTSHPAISQAFVIGVPDVKWGEIGCAWIVTEAGASVTEEEILQLCRDNLTGFKRPRMVRFIDADDLPKTPTGKVQKFKLGEILEQQT